jgi:hypothetical protein
MIKAVDTTNTAGSACPLCCNEFSKADLLYPIHCPTTQCHFQYCMNCIESLINSSNDGYTEASDGSYQVKISIRCPMCRAPYRTPNHPTTQLLGVVSPTAASNAIVGAILKLRQAASIPIPSATTSTTNGGKNNTNDSDLSASQLAQRNHFIMNSATITTTTGATGNGCKGSASSNTTTTIIKELKDAIMTVQQYYDSIDHKDCGTVPSLPWEDWEQYIQTLQRQEQQQQKLQLSNMSISSNHKSNVSDEGPVATASQPQSLLMISRDPTLFMGLDELLTYDEQEFITHMFISGDAELIAQAAHLLHSIMCTMMSQQSNSQPSKDVNSNNSNSSHRSTSTTMTAAKTNTTKKPKTMAQLDHEQKIRKKFPLPNHMPRVVTIQPYNPLNCKNPPIKFVPTPKQPSRPPPPQKTHSPIDNTAATATATANSINAATPTTTTPAPVKQIPPSTKAPSHATELTLASVNGIAGRVGLRRGDIITHVNNERVSTFSEYTIAVQYALEQQEQQIPFIPEHRTGQQPAAMTITVNANADTAQQLLQRAQQMQQQNVRFHC